MLTTSKINTIGEYNRQVRKVQAEVQNALQPGGRHVIETKGRSAEFFHDVLVRLNAGVRDGAGMSIEPYRLVTTGGNGTPLAAIFTLAP